MKTRYFLKHGLWLAAAFVLLSLSASAGKAQKSSQAALEPEPYPFSDRYPVEIVLHTQSDLTNLDQLDLDIETITPLDGTYPGEGDPFETLVARVNVNDREAARLEALGFQVEVIPNASLRAFQAYGPGSDSPAGWPTFDEYVARMQAIAGSYPNLVRMASIGKSVQGRDLWLLKISDNPDLEEDEPEFKYTSTHHGNEPVGTEMTIRLAELLTSSYGVDPDLTALVDNLEIWLGPIYNPDGYEAGSRYNAHGVDLNRDFPDPITDPVDDPSGREPETQAYMYFGYDHSFVMGANYHTGALVVNYPWDGTGHNPIDSPDNDLYHDFSVGYAIRNPMIYNVQFPEGVTEGWRWYTIRGGMQDWAYYWHGEHHVTIELSTGQPPPYNQMDSYWDANRDAMLWWMGRVLTGVRGLVRDADTGAPLDATLTVDDNPVPVYTDPQVGDYHRLLLSGDYNLTASADCHESMTAPVSVISGTITLQDFDLSLSAECQPPGPDLEPSIKTASTDSVLPGEAFEYDLALKNTGLAANALVTDTLPAQVTWTGELTATQGIPVFQDGQITWSGVLSSTNPVTITYGVNANSCLPSGLTISNLAQLDDGLGHVITRTAEVNIANAAPGTPSGPQPADGSGDQAINAQLGWSESSDANCEPLTYAVAFGTLNPPPLVAEGLATPAYDPGDLQGHTTYYWSVTASDSITETAGPVWSFTTLNRAPGIPTLVSPLNGETGVSLNPALAWSGSDADGDALTYSVTLWTAGEPPVVAEGLQSPSFIPGRLKPASTYYWTVSSSDGFSETSGPTWSFTTAYQVFLSILASQP